jgi:probable HAF family extracellular repeat protein
MVSFRSLDRSWQLLLLLVVGLLVFPALAASAPPVPSAQQYVALDLGTLSGGSSIGTGVTEAGQVVGYSVSNDIWHPFVWTRTDGMIDLGLLGGTYALPMAFSENGQVVGRAEITPHTSITHAFSWTRSSGMLDLGTLGGSMSWAQAVSESGSVVGSSYTNAGSEIHPFLWTPSGGMVDLAAADPISYVYGVAINASDQIAVTAARWDAPGVHTYSWTEATGMVDIGSLGGSQTSAARINDDGQVLGLSTTPDGATHIFSWTKSGGIVDLGRLGTLGTSGDCTSPVGSIGGMNAHVQLVGWCWTADGKEHGYSWTSSDGIVDLGTLGGVTAAASAVSDTGLAVGGSTLPGDRLQDAFVWTPSAGMVDLGVGYGSSGAGSVTSSGPITGWSEVDPRQGDHAVLWLPAGQTQFENFLTPVASDGSNRFELGSEIPLSFRLSYSDGTPIANALATLWVSKAGDGAAGMAQSSDASSASTLSRRRYFRYDAATRQYVMNLTAIGTYKNPDKREVELTPGTWTLTVQLGSTRHSVQIELTTPQQGTLTICKAPAHDAAGELFAFTATSLQSGVAQSVTVAGGTCSAPIPAVGPYQIREDPGSGLWKVDGVAVEPTGAFAGEDLTAGWVEVNVGAEDSITATFTNAPPDATITVCTWSKSKAIRGSSFAFVAGGKQLTAIAGTKASPGCSTPTGAQPDSTIKVTESVPPGQTVATITAQGGSRLKILSAGAARLTIGLGPNIVTFENEPAGTS